MSASIADSARRARALAGLQAIALIAIVFGGYRSDCDAPSPPRLDAREDLHGTVPAIDAGAATADAARDEPPCRDGDACERACFAAGRDAIYLPGKRDRHAIESCVRLGDMWRAGTGGLDRNRIAAREAYRSACYVDRDPLACTRLALGGGLLRDLELAPDWIEPDHAPLGLLAAACTGDPTRGALACAALELRRASAELAGDARATLCRAAGVDGGTDRTQCAASVALAVCAEHGDAEACYFAAGDGLASRDAASGRLSDLCSAGDRPACLYRFLRSGERDSLLAACSELESEKSGSIAEACLVRARTEARRATFAARACELGTCQDPAQRKAPLPTAVLTRSCNAGHVNGCANLIFASRDNPAVWRPIRDRILAARPQPPYAARLVGTVAIDELACYLGSVDGCQAAIARSRVANKPLERRLSDYVERLVRPLGP